MRKSIYPVLIVFASFLVFLGCQQTPENTRAPSKAQDVRSANKSEKKKSARKDQQQKEEMLYVYVRSQTTLVPGSKRTVRVRVSRGPATLNSLPITRSNKPKLVPGANVTARLSGAEKTRKLFSSKTGSTGTVREKFTVPDWSKNKYKLKVQVQHESKSRRVTKNVHIVHRPNYKIATDRPIYRPGDTIQARVVVTRQDSKTPLTGQNVEIQLRNARKTLLFRRKKTTNDQGVATVAFDLSDETRPGWYALMIPTSSGTLSIKRILVRDYQMPDFKINIDTNKSHYDKTDDFRGRITAKYYHGSSLRGGKGTAKLYVRKTYDDDRGEQIAKKSFDLDKNGRSEVRVKLLPQLRDELSGDELEHIGWYEIILRVRIKDPGGRIEEHSKVVDFQGKYDRSERKDPKIMIFSEGDELIPDVKNKIHIMLVDSNHDPMPATFHLSTKDSKASILSRKKVSSGPDGHATIHLKPLSREKRTKNMGNAGFLSTGFDYWESTIRVKAKTKDGRVFKKKEEITLDKRPAIKLRFPEEAFPEPGRPYDYSVLATDRIKHVYVDVFTAGELVDTDQVATENGRGRGTIKLPGNTTGPVEVFAYSFDRMGEKISDNRWLLPGASDRKLSVQLSPSRDVLKPAESGKLSIRTMNPEGKGVPASVGVTIYDERLDQISPTGTAMLNFYRHIIQDYFVRIDGEDRDLLRTVLGQSSTNENVRFLLTTRILERNSYQLERSNYGSGASNKYGGHLGFVRDQKKSEFVTPESVEHNDYRRHLKHLRRTLQAVVVTLTSRIARDHLSPVTRKNGEWKWKSNLFNDLLKTIRKEDEGPMVLEEAEIVTDNPPGRPITMQRLADASRWFTPKKWKEAINRCRLVRLQKWIRKTHLERQVLKYLDGEGEWKFRSDAIKNLRQSGHIPQALLKHPNGTAITVETLRSSQYVLDPRNLAFRYSHMNKREFFEKLRDDDWDNGENSYRKKAINILKNALTYDREQGRWIRNSDSGYLIRALRKLDVSPFGISVFADEEEGTFRDPKGSKEHFRASSLLACLFRRSTELMPTREFYNDLEHAEDKYEENTGQDLYSHQKDRYVVNSNVLKKLVKYLPEETRKDPWGNRITLGKRTVFHEKIDKHENFGHVYWRSAGPDGKFHTGDDITSRDHTLSVPDVELQEKYRLKPETGMPVKKVKTSNGEYEYEKLDIDRIIGFTESETSGGGAGGGFLGGSFSASGTASGGSGKSQGTGVRNWFPDTLYWSPLLNTDENGTTSFEFVMADSITSWNVQAQAHTEDGRYGSATTTIRSRKPFFARMNIPGHLSKGDEVTFPVVLQNNTDADKRVRVELELDDDSGLNISGSMNRSGKINKKSVETQYFPMSAERVGSHEITVTVSEDGKQLDAVSRTIDVSPSGKKVTSGESGRLGERESTVRHNIRIPEHAQKGSGAVSVRIYPDPSSLLMDGIRGMLKKPYGCFEQLTSTTYPNVLVVKTLNNIDQSGGEGELREEAVKHINNGYQRMINHQTDQGGFSLWEGRGEQNEPDLFLTAYGVRIFSDMTQVRSVDRQMLEDAVLWLISKQHENGFWRGDSGYFHTPSDVSDKQKHFLKSVYVLKSILRYWTRANDRKQKKLFSVEEGDTSGDSSGGFLDSLPENAERSTDEKIKMAVQKSLNWIKKNRKIARNSTYLLAQTVDLLIKLDPTDPITKRFIQELKDRADRGKRGQVSWSTDGRTLTGSRGKYARIETTALATRSMERVEKNSDLVTGGLQFLLKRRRSDGTWGNTQSTALVLHTLWQCLSSTGNGDTGSVTCKINNQKKTWNLSVEDRGTVKMWRNKSKVQQGNNRVVMTYSGTGQILYQIRTNWWLSEEEFRGGGKNKNLSLDVNYKTTSVSAGETIPVSATVENLSDRYLDMPVLRLSLPAGTALSEGVRDDLKNFPFINRLEVRNGVLTFYMDGLTKGERLQFSFPLVATIPGNTKTSFSRLYGYYNPDREALAEPVEVTISK